MRHKHFFFILLAFSMFFAFHSSFAAPGEGALGGKVQMDGSSTVYPISEAMAEEFQMANRGVRVTVGVSGTGGGFKKLLKKEIDVSGASRPIKDSEIEIAKKNKINFIELPVAYDGIVVVVNPKNDWANTMTVAELKKIWEPNSQVKLWSDIRKGWPDKKIDLFGPGVDSGTFDYFTQAIVGKEKSSRPDFSNSEDDNVLVHGVANDKYAMGYFGYAYYAENKQKLKPLSIDDGKGGVLPTEESILKGTYSPLSRPIFIYVREDVTKRPEIQGFVHFYLKNASDLIPQVGYVPLSKDLYETVKDRFDKGITGSVFAGKVTSSKMGLSDSLKP